MKLTRIRIRVLSFIVFLCFGVAGCGKAEEKKGDGTEVSLQQKEYVLEEKATKDSTIQQALQPQEQRISFQKNNNQTDETTYVLYAVDHGKVISNKKVSLTSFQQGESIEKKCEMMLQQLSEYLGYEINANQSYMEDEVLVIDLNSECAIFHIDNYNEDIKEPVHYANYEDMVFGVLDSIVMTVQNVQNEKIPIRFLMDGKEPVFDTLEGKIELPSGEAYAGYQEQEIVNEKRVENQAENQAENQGLSNMWLGMKHNDVLLLLINEGIETEKIEDFSVLGDYSDCKEGDCLDDYLRNAWLQIELDAKEYVCVFDGPDTTLTKIITKDKKYPSSRGLVIGDTIERMEELYGERYTRYDLEEVTLYEYDLNDCYFQVVVNSDTNVITELVVSTYRESEYLKGEKLLKEVSESSNSIKK